MDGDFVIIGTVEPIYIEGNLMAPDRTALAFVRGLVIKYGKADVDVKDVFNYLRHLLEIKDGQIKESHILKGNINGHNYMQVIEQTDEEKIEMYKKLPVLDIIKMLIECNKIINARAPSIVYTPDSLYFSIKATPYQLCPKCLGSGFVMNTSTPAVSSILTDVCDVCHGAKVIAMKVD